MIIMDFYKTNITLDYDTSNKYHFNHDFYKIVDSERCNISYIFQKNPMVMYFCICR